MALFGLISVVGRAIRKDDQHDQGYHNNSSQYYTNNNQSYNDRNPYNPIGPSYYGGQEPYAAAGDLVYGRPYSYGCSRRQGRRMERRMRRVDRLACRADRLSYRAGFGSVNHFVSGPAVYAAPNNTNNAREEAQTEMIAQGDNAMRVYGQQQYQQPAVQMGSRDLDSRSRTVSRDNLPMDQPPAYEQVVAPAAKS